MKFKQLIRATITILVLGSWIGVAWAAYEVGATVFTKKKLTDLLAEPNRSSTATTSVPWGEKLTVRNQQGVWLHVSSNSGSGWVFLGNVAGEKPPAENTKDFMTSSAAETTAATAARPLAPAAQEFADRRGAAEAARDIQWREGVADIIGSFDVDAYLQQTGKGEFAP